MWLRQIFIVIIVRLPRRFSHLRREAEEAVVRTHLSKWTGNAKKSPLRIFWVRLGGGHWWASIHALTFDKFPKDAIYDPSGYRRSSNTKKERTDLCCLSSAARRIVNALYCGTLSQAL
jgi:hypothetical protein